MEISKFRECQDIKILLLYHTQDTIKANYINFFFNKDTNLIDIDIPAVLDHLYQHYGYIEGKEVTIREAGVLTTPFNPVDPMVAVWNPIERIRKFSEQADCSYMKKTANQSYQPNHSKYLRLRGGFSLVE